MSDFTEVEYLGAVQDSENIENGNILLDNVTFNESSMVTLKNSMFEVIEELRTIDLENEERIKQLLTEKYNLQSQVEDSKLEIGKFKEEKDFEKQNLLKEHDENVKKIELDKMKMTSTVDTLHQEIKHLKSENQTLKLDKYTLEKNLHAQERKNSLQLEGKSNNSIQISSVEDMCRALKKDIGELHEVERCLEQRVKEATTLNRKLEYINKHQTCETTRLNSLIKQLQAELQTVKAQLNSKPCDFQQEILEKQQDILKLKQDKELNEKLLHSIRAELDAKKQEDMKHVASRLEDYKLIQRHVDNIKLHEAEKEQLQEKINNITQKQKQMLEDLEAKEKELCFEKRLQNENLEKWKNQETEMSQTLQSLKEDNERLNKSYNDLDELNSKWATENTNLKEQIQQLELQANKPMRESTTQTVLNTSSVEVQACKEVAEIFMQTEVHCKDVVVQVDNFGQTKVKSEDIGVQVLLLEGCQYGNIPSTESTSKSHMPEEVEKVADRRVNIKRGNSQDAFIIETQSDSEPVMSVTDPLDISTQTVSSSQPTSSVNVIEFRHHKKKDVCACSPPGRVRAALKRLIPEKDQRKPGTEVSSSSQKRGKFNECSKTESGKYTFQFLKFPGDKNLSVTQSLEVNKEPVENSETAAKEKTTSIVGILSVGKNVVKRKVCKRVTFALDANESNNCLKSSTPEKKAGILLSDEDEVLFSDDEEKFELGSQVDVIENVLKS